MIIFIACAFTTTWNTFRNGRASLKGGAIFFDMHQPAGLLNNTYLGNRASYGNDYASYPYALRVLNLTSRSSSWL
jgi:hypothetical protein